MLPRGGISREQLSQLLLVFIGTGADIIEFVSETISDTSNSACSLKLHIVIWSVWAGSLLQFGLVLTAVGGRKTRSGFDNNETVRNEKYIATSTSPDIDSRATSCRIFWINVDVAGMIVILCLQDLPFLISRCYFFFKLSPPFLNIELSLTSWFRNGIKFDLRSQMMIFFTVKNFLVILLQVYRLCVIFTQPYSESSSIQV